MPKLIDWFERWGLVFASLFLLVFIPLYPKFPLFSVPGTYVKIRADDLFVGAACLVWFWLESRRGWKVFRHRLPQLIFIYWLVGGASVFNAILITKTVNPVLAMLHFLRRVEYMLLFFIGFGAWKRRKSWRPVLFGLGVVVLGVAVFGLGQKYYGWPVISTMNEEFSKGLILKLDVWTRISSTFSGHYDLAVFTVLAISVLWGMVLAWDKKGLRRVGFGLILVSFYLLILTSSRVSFGAYLLAVLFILLMAKRYWLIAPVMALSLLAVSFNADLGQRYLATFHLDPNLVQRVKFWEWVGRRNEVLPSDLSPTPQLGSGGALEPILTPQPVSDEQKEMVNPVPAYPEPEPAVIAAQRSSAIRFQVEWPRAVRAFTKNPLLGTGYSSVTLATDNDYLRALAETGLLGFTSFGLIFLEYFRQFLAMMRLKVRKEEKVVLIGLTGAVVGMLANGLFIDVFEASKVAYIFWLLIGMASANLAHIFATQKEKK